MPATGSAKPARKQFSPRFTATILKAPDAFINRCRKVGPGADPELEQFQQGEMAQLLAYALGLPE